jgi:hypothetical protein
MFPGQVVKEQQMAQSVGNMSVPKVCVYVQIIGEHISCRCRETTFKDYDTFGMMSSMTTYSSRTKLQTDGT